MAHPFSISPTPSLESSLSVTAISSHTQTVSDLTWFSAKLEGEFECLLTGVTCINNLLIIVDNENKKLKRFTFDNKLIDHLEMTDPCGITNLPGSKHVVVTEPDQHQISFVSTEIGLSLTSVKKTKKKYESITYLDETKLLTGCCTLGEASVDVLNRNGDVLKSFKKDVDGQAIFRNPASLSRTQKGDILVSDSGHCLLICLNADGDMEFTYDPGGRPSGVCIDGEHIYLCRYDDHAIQVVSSGGEQGCVVLKESAGLKLPLAILVSDKMLVLTEEMPSDRVFMAKLKFAPLNPKQPLNSIGPSNVRVSVMNHKQNGIVN